MPLTAVVKQFRQEVEALYQQHSFSDYISEVNPYKAYMLKHVYTVLQDIFKEAHDSQSVRQKIVYYLKLALALAKDENYFAAGMIYQALRNNGVIRLVKHFELDTSSTHEALLDIFNASRNYANYRKRPKGASTLPYYGVDSSDYAMYQQSAGAAGFKDGKKNRGSLDDRLAYWPIDALQLILESDKTDEALEILKEKLIASFQKKASPLKSHPLLLRLLAELDDKREIPPKRIKQAFEIALQQLMQEPRFIVNMRLKFRDFFRLQYFLTQGQIESHIAKALIVDEETLLGEQWFDAAKRTVVEDVCWARSLILKPSARDGEAYAGEEFPEIEFDDLAILSCEIKRLLQKNSDLIDLDVLQNIALSDGETLAELDVVDELIAMGLMSLTQTRLNNLIPSETLKAELAAFVIKGKWLQDIEEQAELARLKETIGLLQGHATYSDIFHDVAHAALVPVPSPLLEMAGGQEVDESLLKSLAMQLLLNTIRQSEDEENCNQILLSWVDKAALDNIEDISAHLTALGLSLDEQDLLKGQKVSAELVTLLSPKRQKQRAYLKQLEGLLDTASCLKFNYHRFMLLASLSDTAQNDFQNIFTPPLIEALGLSEDIQAVLGDFPIPLHLKEQAEFAFIHELLNELVAHAHMGKMDEMVAILNAFSQPGRTLAQIRAELGAELWTYINISETLYDKIKDKGLPRPIKNKAVAAKVHLESKKQRALIDMLASDTLINIIVVECLSIIKPCTYEAIQKLNQIINNAPSSKKLIEDIDKTLGIGLTIEQARAIKQEIYRRRICHPGILKIIGEKPLKAKKTAKKRATAKMIEALNQAIRYENPKLVQKILERLGISANYLSVCDALLEGYDYEEGDNDFSLIEEDDIVRGVQLSMFDEEVPRYHRYVDAIAEDIDGEADCAALLFGKIVQYQIADDAIDKIDSYIIRQNGRLCYVRNAKGASTEDIRSIQYMPTRMRSSWLKKRLPKKKGEHIAEEQPKHFNYLIMAINYTIALRAQVLGYDLPSLDKAAFEKSLLALINQFEAKYNELLASEEFKEEDLLKYFVDYVKYDLAPNLMRLKIAPTIQSAIGMLDKAKDWASCEMPPMSVATIDRMDYYDEFVIRLDKPQVQLTEKLKEQYRLAYEGSEEEQPLWYKSLKANEKKVFRYYYPKIIAGREIPSQLRTRLPGLKNSYQQDIYSVKNKKTKRIMSSCHCGSISYLSKKLTPELDEHMKEMAVLTGEQQRQLSQSDAHIMISLNSSQADRYLARWAAFKGEDYVALDEKIVANTRHAGDQVGGMYSANVCLNIWRLKEANDYRGIALIYEQCMEAYESLISFKLSWYPEEVRAALMLLGQSLKLFHERLNDKNLFLDSDVNGLQVIGECARCSYQLKNIKTALEKAIPQSHQHYELLHDAIEAIPTFDIWYGCASGENRTGITEFHIQMEAILREFAHATKGDADKIKQLRRQMAASGHIQTITGHQGGNFGTGGVRDKSIGSVPDMYGQGVRELLSTEWASLKSVLAVFEKRQKKGEVSRALALPQEAIEFYIELIKKDESFITDVFDTNVLKAVVQWKPELFFKLDSVQQKQTHLALLQLSALEKNLLRFRLLEAINEPSATTALATIHQGSLEVLQTQCRIAEAEDLTLEELFDFYETGMHKVQNAPRLKALVKCISQSLTEKEKDFLFVDKALMLIEDYLSTSHYKYKTSFFRETARMIRKHGMKANILKALLKKADVNKLFRFEGVWLSRDKADLKTRKLFADLYALCPGSRPMTERELDDCYSKGIVPNIDVERAREQRATVLEPFVQQAIVNPTKILSSPLCHIVRHRFTDYLEVLSRGMVKKQVEAEAIYQQYLVHRVKYMALRHPQSVRYSTQGHIIVDLSLSDTDYQNVYRLITGEECDTEQAKALVEQQLGGIQLTRTTVCNIDTVGHPKLEAQFVQWASSQAIDSDVDGQVLNEALKCFMSSHSRGSAIPLQEEMGFHLRLVSRVMEKLYQEKIDSEAQRYTKAHWQQARDIALHAINDEVRKVWQQCLVAAYSKQRINFKMLNKSLDDARLYLVDLVKQHLMGALKHLDESLNLQAFNHLFTQVLDTSAFDKHLFCKSPATGLDYLRADSRNQTCVRISGSEYTAHDKRLGDGIQARRHLYRNHYYANDGVSLVSTNRSISFEARVPSLAVNENHGELLQDTASVYDVRDKLQHAYDSFKALTHQQRGPVVYNLLTSIYDCVREQIDSWTDAPNRQTKSAKRILFGAHLFNKQQVAKGRVNGLVYVQNIPVNQHSLKLALTSVLDGFTENGKIVREATIMAELSLLSTLFANRNCFLPEIKESIITYYQSIHGLYAAFLKNSDGNPKYFHHSKEGKKAIKKLKLFKKEMKEKREPVRDKVTLKELAANTLYRLLVSKSYRTKKLGMLVQALSVFLEEASIAGCKSANERYQAVSGRVDLLKSINNRQGPYSQEEQMLVDALYAASRGEGDKAFTALQKAMDKAYMHHNLYGAASAFSCEDQGASAKVQAAKKGKHGKIPNINTNIAESPYIGWLAQKSPKQYQAHKGDHAEDIRDITRAMIDGRLTPSVSKPSPVVISGNEILLDCLAQQSLHAFAVPLLDRLQTVAQAYLMSQVDIPPEYEAFRQSFAVAFGVNESDFKWPVFNKFLLTLKNKSETQLIMALAMRQFMMNMMRSQGIEESVYKKLIEVQDGGHYEPLTFDTIKTYLCTPLSISFKVFESESQGQTVHLDYEYEAPVTEPCVTLYHEAGAYRVTRRPIDQVDDSHQMSAAAVSYVHDIEASHLAVDETHAIVAFKTEVSQRLAATKIEQAWECDLLADKPLVAQHEDKPVPVIIQHRDRAFSTVAVSPTFTRKPASFYHPKDKTSITPKARTKISSKGKKSLARAEEALATLTGCTLSSSYQEQIDSLDTIMSPEMLERLERMADVAYHAIDPKKAADYISHLASIKILITDHLNLLEGDKEKFKDKSTSCSEEERLLLELGLNARIADIEKYQVMLAKVNSLITLFDEAQKGAQTIGFNEVSTTIMPLTQVESIVGTPIVSQSSALNVELHGKPYRALPKIDTGSVALHRFESADSHQLAYIENDSHTRVMTDKSYSQYETERDKMQLAMTMMRQMFLNLKRLPCHNNLLIVRGKDPQLAEYMWAAIHMLHKRLPLDFLYIDVTVPGFRPRTTTWSKKLVAIKEMKEALGKTYINNILKTIEEVFRFKKNELSQSKLSHLEAGLARLSKSAPVA